MSNIAGTTRRSRYFYVFAKIRKEIDSSGG
jgi:hypothetical protein